VVSPFDGRSFRPFCPSAWFARVCSEVALFTVLLFYCLAVLCRLPVACPHAAVIAVVVVILGGVGSHAPEQRK
jgi:hypothetical protein